MMKTKYDVPVCWYVHSDQRSQNFGVGHRPIWINKQLTFPSMHKTQPNSTVQKDVVL